VFYSRTGTTKQIGEALAQLLECDSEELVDTKKRISRINFSHRSEKSEEAAQQQPRFSRDETLPSTHRLNPD
jgi:hypothetical protein